jgi:hypothetical protein
MEAAVELVPNWKTVLIKSWSARIMALIGVLATLVDYVPYFDFLPKGIVVALVIAGLGARVVQQNLATPPADPDYGGAK